MKRHDVEVGEWTYGVPNVYAYYGRKLKIGKFCRISHGVTVHFEGGRILDHVSTYPFTSFLDDWPAADGLDWKEVVQAGTNGDVVIGNDIWIGANAFILSGVSIGDGAVIGACSIVTKSVEPYAIVAGNPAREIRKRFDDNTIRRLLDIRWWDWPPDKIGENLSIIQSDNVSALLEL